MLSFIPMEMKCPTTKTTAMSAVLAALCGACCQPICDRYIMRVVDTSYHERCLQCTSCSVRLMHSCFTRDGKLYCRIDYERLFAKNKCLSCGEKICSDEFVMRASDNIFHLKCFICVVCGVQLKKGDHYVVKQCQLFCRMDYEKEVEMLQSFNYDEYLCDEICTKNNNRRGPKRPRTILTTQQRRAFKACFDISPRPCRKTRETLANDTGLSLRIVQVWFQNQRAKMKKIEKKGKQKASDSETSDNRNNKTDEDKQSSLLMANIKDEIQSDSESLVSGGSTTSINDDHSKIIKRELDDEKHLNTDEPNLISHLLDDVRDKSTESNFDYPQLQHLVNHFNYNNFLNPIDRLYSMQNLYFCGEKNNPDDFHH